MEYGKWGFYTSFSFFLLCMAQWHIIRAREHPPLTESTSEQNMNMNMICCMAMAFPYEIVALANKAFKMCQVENNVNHATIVHRMHVGRAICAVCIVHILLIASYAH